MKENRFFTEYEHIVRAYDDLFEMYSKLREKIVDIFGEDSQELEAWDKLEEHCKYPVSRGALKAYRAWKDSDDEDVIMSDHTCGSEERHDFIVTLRRAGLRGLVVTNRSGGLLEDLHGYVAEGCTLEGLCRYGDEEILGVRFRIN